MNKYKVCVYAICKNEEQFADRWMDSMSEADLVVVTDTGSADGTVQKLQARGALVYSETVEPWRFDAARNLSLSHVPADADICVCTDLDEVFTKGWRARLEACWTEGSNAGRYLYNWSFRPDGTPDVQFFYFKIHARFSHEWIYPVHECLRYIGEGAERAVRIDGIELNHYPDGSKSRASYLPLLKTAVSEAPGDDRMTYYLGREYFYAGEYAACVETLEKHLSLPSAAWADERCASMRLIAKAHGARHDHKNAKSWFLRAAAELPGMREAYVECAQQAYSQADWPLCLFAAEAALKIAKKSETYVNAGYAWDHTPSDLAAIAAYRLGFLRRAAGHAAAALKLSPDDPRLRENLRVIEAEAQKSPASAE